MLTKFFKGFRPEHITQYYHAGHQALDIVDWTPSYGYGTPLCAPENCLVLGIRGDGFTPDDHKNLEHGYGISLRGLETGHEYLFWHCLPLFPVHGGDVIERGHIVGFMGNSGNVWSGGKYVPLEERTNLPHAGTHLHIEMSKDGKRINPYPLINWNWKPQWGMWEYMKAHVAILEKAVRLLTS